MWHDFGMNRAYVFDRVSFFMKKKRERLKSGTPWGDFGVISENDFGYRKSEIYNPI